MRGLLRRRMTGLARDARGASVIEFALCAPVLALILVGLSDVAMGYSRKLTLEQAAYRALEKVAVGSVQSDYQFLKAEAATAAGVPQSDVTVENWLECDQVEQTEFEGECPSGQMVSRYVRVTIDSTYTPRFGYGPLARTSGRPDGRIPVSGSAALRIQ